MKLFVSVALAGVLLATAAWAQPEYMMNGNLCLKSYQIDTTRVPNDHTIVFHMKDGKAFVTTLRGNCTQLSINGFTYLPSPPDEVCGNLQAIRSNNSGSVCTMGQIVPYTPAAHTQM